MLTLGVVASAARAGDFEVTNTNPTGSGSLQQALIMASDTPGNRVVFNIPNTDPGFSNGVWTIKPTSALQLLNNDGMSVDGYTQPGASPNTLADGNNAVIKIVIDGSIAGNVNGLRMVSPNCSVTGLCIVNFASGSAVSISDQMGIGCTVAGNYLGVDVTGTIAQPNNSGVYIQNEASSNMVGGTTPAARNIIGGSLANGVTITGNASDSNTVVGNYVGTNAAGTAALGNTNGVAIIGLASGNTVGGTTAAARNVISGNSASAGVVIFTLGTISNNIMGNYIGTDVTGTQALPNGDGVILSNLTNYNVIGGTDASMRNIISGNTNRGVYIIGTDTEFNTVQGNYIGLDVTGNKALPNNVGVRLDLSNVNTIGGASAGARNIISGNRATGIEFAGGANNNTIIGNYIGLNAAGTAAIGNTTGINMNGSSNANIIGGTTAAERNVIAGNTTGIIMSGTGTNSNTVQGNYIGTDFTGTTAIPHTLGIFIVSGAQNNIIGGSVAGAGNLIAGTREANTNAGAGIALTGSGTSGNTVVGNYIGTTASGLAELSNDEGVRIDGGATSNTIGGLLNEERNVISGNRISGINIIGSGTTLNSVLHNYIGTDATGFAALPNPTGVSIGFGAQSNTIGGTATGSGNVISGNIQRGVDISGNFTSSNTVAGNLIGVDATGAAPLPNTWGVVIAGAAQSNLIGGVAATARNIIAFNQSDGVWVTGSGGVGNSIRRNVIYSNGGLGINIGDDASTPNDLGDADSGPNRLQNYPVVTGVTITGGNTTIGVNLDSSPNTLYVVDLYRSDTPDPSNYGEGKTYIATVNVTTDENGYGVGSVTVSASLAGQYFTATATNNSFGDTSEFSRSLRSNSAVVLNTNDSGTGSLRTAINFANANPGALIVFSISALDPGFVGGEFVIKPASPLPQITADGTIVDGTTQPGGTIVIDGSNPEAGQDGVVMSSFNSAISGVTVRNFPRSGLALNGFIDISNNNFSATNIDNIGTVTWNQPKDITAGNRAIFNNHAGATFLTVQDANTRYAFNGQGGTPIFNNGGDFFKDGFATTTFAGVDFNNTGTLTTAGGTLRFTDGIFTQSAGTLRLQNGFITNNKPLAITGGVVTGTGTIAGNVNNNGQLLLEPQLDGPAPATPGRTPRIVPRDTGGLITVAGNLTQGANSTVSIGIAGTTNQAGQFLYGRLRINNNLTLSNSALNVVLQNYTPQPGEVYEIIRAQSISGTFKSVTLPALPVGQLSVVQTANAFYLVTGPIISGFSPLGGVAADGATPGTSVTIAGANFTNPANLTPTVKFNGVAATVTSFTSTQIVTTVPQGATSGKITVTTSGGTATSATNFAVTPLPKITSFTPTAGPAATVVTINGSNFAGATAVRFNNSSAPGYTVNQAGTQIVVALPTSATTGKITVSTPIGTATSATDFIVTILKPTVTNIDVRSGPPGTRIMVTGTSFIGVTSVKIGTVAAAFTVLSTTSLRAVVAANGVSGVVSVTNTAGTNSGSQIFTVTAPPPAAPRILSLSPAEAKAGTTITITGANFTGATVVKFNNKNAASFTVLSPIYIRAVVPEGMQNGPVIVTTAGGTAQSPVDFNLLLPPTIATFSPVRGPVGSQVTITGANLSRATLVRFNNKNTAVFTKISDTELRATVPAGMINGPVGVTTTIGTVLSKGQFFVEAPPNITTFSPASGKVGATITINGTGFTGLRSLKFFNDKQPAIVSITDTKIVAKVPAGATRGPLTVSTALGSMTTKGEFIVVPGAPPRDSGVVSSVAALSSATVNATTGTVELTFNSALDAESAADAALYTVTVNNIGAVGVESAAYDAAKRRVTLGLAEGTLQSGSSVTVVWSDILDARGGTVAGRAGPLTAR